MMFGCCLIFDSDKKFLLTKNSIAQILKKKQGQPKRAAKVGFYLAQKKASADKYLLIIGEVYPMFGKCEMLKPITELNFWQMERTGSESTQSSCHARIHDDV